MSKLSLKVVVAGRTYPLTVNPGEEAKVTKAAEDINRAIKSLQDNYAVKDMQDLLAMTALQLATRSTQVVGTTPAQADYSDIENQLEILSSEFDALK
ncbi:MAG: cell division protein ZapA [Crocinitomicaceae bacterium]|jgi:cell division protein ZapA (FtsZ GTPase activity inhibitor)|nr:cell division protein ZapA [Crocinitomicaceae bacterium]MDP4865930.1 cell division protein ZapA [Crocinitomicaceae bacterium]MDP5010820.1 cell division protein ZapA [Crocinitomicaceae bacterium]